MEKKQAYLFVDFQNQPVDFELVYNVLSEEYRIVGSKAYGHWVGQASSILNYSKMGTELMEIPEEGFGNNKRNDVKLMVDSMELLFTHENIDVFIIIAGDLDYHPLISKLKEYGKFVVTVAREKSTSPLIMRISDRFIPYNEIVKERDSIEEHLDKNIAELSKEIVEVLFERDAGINVTNIKKVLISMRVIPSRYRYSSIHTLAEAIYNIYKDKVYLESYEKFLKKLIAVRAGKGFDKKELISYAEERQRWTLTKTMTLDKYINSLVSKGDIEQKDSLLYIPVPKRWDLLLKRELPFPEMIDRFIEKVFPLLKKGGKTLKEILEYIKNTAEFETKVVNSLGRLIKFSGRLIGPNESDYVSYNTFIRIDCSREELLKSIILSSVKRVMKVCEIAENELEDFYRYVAGDKKEIASEEFEGLVSNGEVTLEDGVYYYKRK